VISGSHGFIVNIIALHEMKYSIFFGEVWLFSDIVGAGPLKKTVVAGLVTCLDREV
jgi:hypothetical protein